MMRRAMYVFSTTFEPVAKFEGLLAIMLPPFGMDPVAASPEREGEYGAVNTMFCNGEDKQIAETMSAKQFPRASY